LALAPTVEVTATAANAATAMSSRTPVRPVVPELLTPSSFVLGELDRGLSRRAI
jgi:hypothetical protein